MEQSKKRKKKDTIWSVNGPDWAWSFSNYFLKLLAIVQADNFVK